MTTNDLVLSSIQENTPIILLTAIPFLIAVVCIFKGRSIYPFIKKIDHWITEHLLLYPAKLTGAMNCDSKKPWPRRFRILFFYLWTVGTAMALIVVAEFFNESGIISISSFSFPAQAIGLLELVLVSIAYICSVGVARHWISSESGILNGKLCSTYEANLLRRSALLAGFMLLVAAPIFLHGIGLTTGINLAGDSGEATIFEYFKVSLGVFYDALFELKPLVASGLSPIIDSNLVVNLLVFLHLLILSSLIIGGVVTYTRSDFAMYDSIRRIEKFADHQSVVAFGERASDDVIEILKADRDDASITAATALGEMAVSDSNTTDQIGNELVPTIRFKSGRNSSVRIAAIQALGQIIGDIQNEPEKSELVEKVRKELLLIANDTNDYVGVQVTAIGVINESKLLNDIAELTALAEIMLDNSSPDLRQAISMSIAEHDFDLRSNARVKTILRKLYSSDRRSRVRARLADAIMKVDPEFFRGVIRECCDALLNGDRQVDRAVAAKMLGEEINDDRAALNALLQAVNDDSIEVRKAIVRALGQASTLNQYYQEQAIAALAEFLQNDETGNRVLRVEAAKSLGAFSDHPNLKARCANLLLSKLGNETAISVIKAATKSMRSLGAAKQLAEAIGYLNRDVVYHSAFEFTKYLTDTNSESHEELIQQLELIVMQNTRSTITPEDIDTVKQLSAGLDFDSEGSPQFDDVLDAMIAANPPA